MAAPSDGARNPDHRSTEGISTAGQSRQSGSGTLRRTVEIARWSNPNRTRITTEYLRERNGSCSQVWRGAGAPSALVLSLPLLLNDNIKLQNRLYPACCQ